MISVRWVRLFCFRSLRQICKTDEIRKKIQTFNLSFLRSEPYSTAQIRNTNKFEKSNKKTIRNVVGYNYKSAKLQI